MDGTARQTIIVPHPRVLCAVLREAGCRDRNLPVMLNIVKCLLLCGDTTDTIIQKWRGYRPGWWKQ